MIRAVMKIFVALVALAFVVITIFVASRQHLKFDVPNPAITASADPAVVERGRYLVRNVANCAECHGDPTQHEALVNGAEVPLSGGFVFDVPPGKFYVRNITPDPGTGLGRASDGAIARALRMGVGPDGRALLPFMEMQGLADDDLVAVVSYLRTLAPVRNPVPDHQFNLLGMVVKATVLANPVKPRSTPPANAPRGATVEAGRYLVQSVANCWACHTQRDFKTGALAGPMLGGGTGLADDYDAKRTWSPPNLTGDPTTGRLASFSEETFVARFRTGRVIPGSPMPWEGYRRLDDDDLKAIYRYLKTVPLVVRDVGPPFVIKK